MNRLELDIPVQMILYTDTVDGKQTCRDDLWAVSTDALNTLARDKDRLREAEKIIKDLHYVAHSQPCQFTECPFAEWLASLERE